jgi:hypothetical protein
LRIAANGCRRQVLLSVVFVDIGWGRLISFRMQARARAPGVSPCAGDARDDAGLSRDPAWLTDNAIFALARGTPSLSAQKVVTPCQAMVFGAAAIAIAAATCVAPRQSIAALVTLMSLGFVVSVAFRAMLAWIGGMPTTAHVPVEARAPDASLPLYTILVPLYREATVLPRLVHSLLALDYPGIR